MRTVSKMVATRLARVGSPRLLASASGDGRASFSRLVKEAATLSEVIEESGVDVEHRGAAIKARCPFHGAGNERTPSLAIDDEKGVYHCFGCGAHGDVFEFVKEHENVDFRAALCSLAERYGVVDTAPRAPRSNAERANAWREERLRQALAAATDYYAKCLSGGEGAPALELLKRRGVSRASAIEFRLGFAPYGNYTNRIGCYTNRISCYTDDDLVDAGLCVRRDDGRLSHRFRNRLMVPICDARGAVVGFGARVVDDADPSVAKYINSRDSPVFKKVRRRPSLAAARTACSAGALHCTRQGEILFAAHLARKAAKKDGRTVIVEGCAPAAPHRARPVARDAGLLMLASSRAPQVHGTYCICAAPQVHGRDRAARRGRAERRRVPGDRAEREPADAGAPPLFIGALLARVHTPCMRRRRRRSTRPSAWCSASTPTRSS